MADCRRSITEEVCQETVPPVKKKRRPAMLSLDVHAAPVQLTSTQSAPFGIGFDNPPENVAAKPVVEGGDYQLYYYITRRGLGRRVCEDICSADAARLFFGVYDGHGGVEAAQYASQNICAKYRAGLSMHDAFVQTDVDFMSHARSASRCGTTALVASFRDGTLTIAHVGDSRAMLVRDGASVQLTVDHFPNRGDELRRVEERGGYVLRNRVSGMVTVSRAIGDAEYKSYIISVPDVMDLVLTPHDELVVMASDGIWSVLSEYDVISALQSSRGDLRAACDAVVSAALARRSTDDMSVLIINLRQLQLNQ